MNKNLLLLLFIAISFSLNAQNYTIGETTHSLSLDIGDSALEEGDIYTGSYITNTSGATITIEWERMIVEIADGWLSAVCIGDDCFIPNINAYNFDLAPGDTVAVLMHVYPGDSGNILPGTADLHLELTDGTTTTLMEFDFEVSELVSNVETPKKTTPKLYPNPANDFFSLSGVDQVKSAEVYNLLGRKVKSFPVSTHQSYDINDLHRGLYLVRLLTVNQEIVRTIKLDKR